MFYETRDPAGGHGLKYDPFKSLIVPRPIGWISSQDRNGVVNLAPYSFFNAVADAPPIVMFSANGAHREGGWKDTVKNVQETGEFVCNLATWETREAMNATSATVARSVDELALAGLTPLPSRLVAPPRVAESPAHLECRHLRTVELPSDEPGQPNLVVFGQVVGVHIDDRILRDGRVDSSAFRPIARLGYAEYTVVERVFSMRRP
jgi:flavin reductase (DIM6/NTAB) family NADH-FMN oxidoreductase RutF